MLDSILPEGTFLSANPVLSIVIVAAAAAVVFLIVAAILTSIKPRSPSSPTGADPVVDALAEAIEIGGGRRSKTEETAAPTNNDRSTVTKADETVSMADALPSEPPVRRGFGYGALLLAFVIGAGAGFASVSFISKSELRAAIQGLAALLDDNPEVAASPVDQEVPRNTKQVTERLPALEEAEALAEEPQEAEPQDQAADLEEVSTRLTAFTDGLKGSLPRDAGPDIVLTSVEADGMDIRLGYTVLRQMPADTVTEFEAFIEKTVKSLFCGDGAQELRFLNDNGVSFHMNYTDPKGEPVTAHTVPPSFCA